jgi:hypothetical protein
MRWWRGRGTGWRCEEDLRRRWLITTCGGGGRDGPGRNENLADTTGTAVRLRRGNAAPAVKDVRGHTGVVVIAVFRSRLRRKTASACPRWTLRVRAGLPSAGDGPPSPWPRIGSRYDLARLYRLRRRGVSGGTDRKFRERRPQEASTIRLLSELGQHVTDLALDPLIQSK